MRQLWFLLASFLLGSSFAQSQIVINNLSDFNLGQVAATSGDLELDIAHCVLMDAVGRYQVVAFGNGLGGAFHLTSGGYALPYQVFYRDRRNAGGGQALTPGVPTGNFRGRRNRPQLNWQCRNDNSNIRILILGQDLESAAAGFYSGTLTLTVVPI